MRPDRLTSDLPATVPATPPWRTLGLLAAGVLAAHALVLQTRPARFGPVQVHLPQRVAVLATRTLPPAPDAARLPAAEPTAPAAPTPRPSPPPARKPIFKKNKPSPHDSTALSATDSIASPALPETATGDITALAEPESTSPATLPPADSAPTPGADSATAAAAMPAASEAPAPSPPGPAAQTPVTAMALPASARLEYRMTGSAKGLNYHATGALDWQHSGGRYDLRMTVRALFLGSRTLSSTGQVSAEGLAPTRFTDKSRTEVAAHFQPDKGQISFSANTPPVAWVQGAQDRVSVFLQLGGMLAGKPDGFAAGSTISTLTAGPRDADLWTFVVHSPELLDLPFGPTAAVRLSRQPRREYDQKVEIWFAPALGYLPVRSRITQANGDFVDQELSALTRP